MSTRDSSIWIVVSVIRVIVWRSNVEACLLVERVLPHIFLFSTNAWSFRRTSPAKVVKLDAGH